MVFSASYYMAQASKDYNYDGLYLFKKQLFGAAIGLAAMIFFTFFDYKKLFKLRYIILAIAGVFLLAVLVPGVGVTLNGSSRWIRVLGISIQPAEIAKIALIIFIASSIYINRNRMSTFRCGMLPPLLVLLPICVLLYFQPNYSAIIVLAALTFIMIFVGGVTALLAESCLWYRNLTGSRGLLLLWTLGRIRPGTAIR